MKFYTDYFIEYIYKEIDIKLLLVTVNNRLKFEIEIVHDLSCHPIIANSAHNSLADSAQILCTLFVRNYSLTRTSFWMDMEFRHVSESISRTYCVSVRRTDFVPCHYCCNSVCDNEVAWCKDTLQVARPARTLLRPKQCSTRLCVQSRSSTWLESLKRETPTVQRTLADSTRLLFCSIILLFVLSSTVIFVIHCHIYCRSLWLYLLLLINCNICY